MEELRAVACSSFLCLYYKYFHVKSISRKKLANTEAGMYNKEVTDVRAYTLDNSAHVKHILRYL